jgi:nucleotide-binding universal stress UspA family protein
VKARRSAGPILHATDFSPASRPALAEALAWARRDGAPLVVLHVRTPPSPFAAGSRPPASYLELEARDRRHVRRRLARLVAGAGRALAEVRGEVAEGAPAEAIVRAAGRHRARAIVVGTRGRSGLGRALMGSVAHGVLARARCPVLTVRAGRRG